MATTTIDTTELEYLKSCRDKLRDIVEIISEEAPTPEGLGSDRSVGAAKRVGNKEMSMEEKLREIKKIIKN